MTHYEKLGELVLDKNGKRQGNRKGTIELRWLDDRNIAISLNVPLIAPESDPLRLLMTAANAFAAVLMPRSWIPRDVRSRVQRSLC